MLTLTKLLRPVLVLTSAYLIGVGALSAQVLNDKTGDVQGSVFTNLRDVHIQLNGFEVFLENQDNKKTTKVAMTNEWGKYLFQNVPGGKYRLCWKVQGWQPGCSDKDFNVKNNISYPAPQQVSPAKGYGTVSGRVSFSDGSTPYFKEAYFASSSNAIVELLDAQGSVIASTTPNTAGHYAFSGLPDQKMIVQSRVSGESIKQQILTRSFGLSVDLEFKNTRPSIISISENRSPADSIDFKPGQVVKLLAEVVDSKEDLPNLKYTWRTAPANGSISEQSGKTVVWQLAKQSGPQKIYLQVDDGRGGFATSSFTVKAGATTSTFTGRLVDLDGNAIPEASITAISQRFNRNNSGAVNLQRPVRATMRKPVETRSNGAGMFALKTRLGERFVLNVEAPGFVPISRIIETADSSLSIRMRKSFSAEINLDEQNEIVDLSKTRENRRTRSRATVRVDGSRALVNENGSDLSSPVVQVDIANLDIARGEMPGNFLAVGTDGFTSLESYGAVDITFRDQNGRALQLRKGEVAEVTIPAPGGLEKRPDEIPIWYYDRADGLWKQYRTNAKYNPELDAYVGLVTHFSTVNFDIQRNGGSCARVLLDNIDHGAGLKARFQIQVPSQSKDVALDEALSVVYSLPVNTDIDVQILDAQDNVVSNIEVYLYDTQTGQEAILPLQNNIYRFDSGLGTAITPPVRPYSECRTLSVRRDIGGAGGNSGAQQDDLLFLQNTFGLGSQALTVGYYKAQDPNLVESIDISGNFAWTDTNGNSDHATLGQWWSYAGFNQSGQAADEAEASYMNYNDLGFGRNMHIRRDEVTGDMFAYVSNYGENQIPVNAVNAYTGTTSEIGQNVINAPQPFATVVMESIKDRDAQGNAIVTSPGLVNFWVYAGDAPGAPLVNSADLDGLGQKFIPQLCQVCHGGAVYNPLDLANPSEAEYNLRPGGAAVGASYREFDLPTYLLVDDSDANNITPFPGIGINPAIGFNLSGEQQLSFYELNELVKLSNPQPHIVELIEGWHDNISPNATATDIVDNNGVSAVPDFDWAPEGWEDGSVAGVTQIDEDFYGDLIGKSCRTCHIAFDDGLAWNSKATFVGSGLGSFNVCNSTAQSVMPHALTTYRNFWLEGLGEPYEPQAFIDYYNALNPNNPITDCRGLTP